LARNADAAGTQAETGNGRLNLARAIGDVDTTSVVPAGAGTSGGPFVGPYVAAAALNAALEGKCAPVSPAPSGCTITGGLPDWQTSALKGWKELQPIPLRVHLTNTGGSAASTDVVVNFDHTQGGTTPGIQDLTGFTAGAGVTINSGPTLEPMAGDKWDYKFNVTVAAGANSAVTFTGKMAAGAHGATGNSLSLGGS